MNNKPFAVVAYLGWGSAFVLIWLLLFKVVPADWMSLGAFLFFVVVGFFASAMLYDKRNAETYALLKRISDSLPATKE